MRKFWQTVAMALLLAVCMNCAAVAEMGYDWSDTYNAYYLVYDSGDLRDWSRTDYAGNEGMLLYMYDGQAEVSVSLQERSDAPTLDDLADQQLQYVHMYGEVTCEDVRSDWYAAWDSLRPGMKMTYTYTFGRVEADQQYDVVKYMAALNDDKYLMIDVMAQAGAAASVAAELETGFLAGLTVDSFPVSGGASAYLTGVNEKDGKVYLTLQPFEVIKGDSGTYGIQTVGEPQVLPMSSDARMLAPEDENTGILADVAITERAISSFIDGYRLRSGKDCVFNLLLSDDEVRWMTYSYLY